MSVISDTEFGWLAGFFDGEGTVALSIRPSAAANGGPKIQPFCAMSGTEPGTFPVIVDVLTRAGIAHWTGWNKARGTGRNGNPHKDAWTVTMAGLTRSHNFLSWVLPALVTKRARAELCLTYIASRRSHHDFRTPILASEWMIAAQLRALNSKGRGLPSDIRLNLIMPSVTAEEARARGVKGAAKRWGTGFMLNNVL